MVTSPTTYDPELVLKVNELFHDIQNAHYDKIHPEIMNDEVRRWDQTAARLLGGGRGPVRMLDIGSGTGFVGLRFGAVLRAEDHLTCADLSAKMLGVCEGKLRGAGLRCDMEFRKLDGRTIGRDGDRFDVITMNSVLHHLPQVEETLRELDGLLAPGGVLVIAHEPNRIFADSFFMRANQNIFRGVQKGWGGCRWRMRAAAGALLRAVGLRKRKQEGAVAPPVSLSEALADDQVLDDAKVHVLINERLVKEGVLQRPLTLEELFAITDLHDHRDGESHKVGFGFDMFELTRRVLPRMKVETFESYNHLSFLTETTAGSRRYAAMLQRIFPRHGATFFAVLRKNPAPVAASRESVAAQPSAMGVA